MEFFTKPIEDFAALAERNPLAASLVLALVISAGVFVLLRTIFKQKASQELSLNNLKFRELELENQRMQQELANAHDKNKTDADSATLERLPQLLELIFKQAGRTVEGKFDSLIERFAEMIHEQKRNNDLTEANSRQRQTEQQQILATNKAGFNNLGALLSDKLDVVVDKVDSMKEEVIEDIGEISKQLRSVVDELKGELKGLPLSTAEAIEARFIPLLEAHTQAIDAKLQALLDEIRAGQTQPVKPVEPPAE